MRLSADRHNKPATGQICTRKGYLLTNSEKKYLKEALETGRAVSSEELGLHGCGGDRAKHGGIPQSSRNTLPSLLITHRLNSETVEIPSPEWTQMPHRGALRKTAERWQELWGARGVGASQAWPGIFCLSIGPPLTQMAARVRPEDHSRSFNVWHGGQQRSSHKCSIS